MLSTERVVVVVVAVVIVVAALVVVVSNYGDHKHIFCAVCLLISNGKLSSERGSFSNKINISTTADTRCDDPPRKPNERDKFNYHVEVSVFISVCSLYLFITIQTNQLWDKVR